MLEKRLLSGPSWWLAPDPKRAGEGAEPWFSNEWFDAHAATLKKITVPMSWQTLQGLERYEGVCWFFTTIPRRLLELELPTTNHVSLRFNGINYLAKIWLNGVETGQHEGGYTPFSLHLSQATLKRVVERSHNDILLAARVDNTRRHDQLPEFSADWFIWGGIYRNVYLDIQPGSRVAQCLVAPVLAFTPAGAVAQSAIKMTIHAAAGLGFSWTITSPRGDVVATGTTKIPINESPATTAPLIWRRITVPIPAPALWSPNSPVLYRLELHDEEKDLLFATRFGMRAITARGQDILLNGKKILLKGCSLHEEHYPLGREYPKEQRRADVLGMKALGFNFLRTAHYSHDESLIDACDEEGLLVGEEIPVYWNIDFRNHDVQRLAARLMRDLIRRDFNHPSVIWWSAGNEVPVSRRDCSNFMTTIMALAKRLDPTRFSVFVTKAFIYDPARKHSDLLLLNSYFGWYYLSERLFGSACDVVHGTAPRKPFIMSEFGANAMRGFGRHEAIDVKSSEWKQASIVSHAVKTFNGKPYMSGWAIWIYRDFKSHMRTGKYEQGYNRKGLVDEQDRKKLLALWMPKLVNERRPFHRWKAISGVFGAKIAYFPAAFFDVIVDIISPLFMHKVNTGYYIKDVK
nr:glycoside hydrolase family 2 TIM barrel-domain containing protein [Candidatus Sigynarchaeota archaeon]